MVLEQGVNRKGWAMDEVLTYDERQLLTVFFTQEWVNSRDNEDRQSQARLANRVRCKIQSSDVRVRCGRNLTGETVFSEEERQMALSLVQTAWSGIQSDPDMQAAVAECASLMRKLGGVDTRVVCEHDPLVMEERLASAAWPLQIRGH